MAMKIPIGTGSSLSHPFASLIKLVIVLLLFGFIVYLAITFYSSYFVSNTISSVAEDLAHRSGFNENFVHGLVIFATIPFFIAIAKFAGNPLRLVTLQWSPLDFYKKRSGIVIVVYVGLYYIALGWASQKAYGSKFCVITPEGLTSSDNPGKDSKYSLDLHPCTDQEKRMLAGADIKTPAQILIANPYTYLWFDGRSGYPAVWYVVDSNGQYRFFDAPGRDPVTDQPLLDITPEVVQLAKERKDKSDKKRLIAEQAQLNAAQEEAKRHKIEDLTQKAQSELDNKDFEHAIDDCNQVLKAGVMTGECDYIKRIASAKLAEQLSNQASKEIQMSQYIDAEAHAEKATKLDPDNAKAAQLLKIARALRLR